MLKTALFFGCAAVISVAQLLILRLALSRQGATAGDARVPRSGRSAELAWAFLPAVGLALVLWLTWREVRHAPAHPSPVPGAHLDHGSHQS